MTERDFAAWEREAALDRETALDRAVADDHEVADELRVLLQLAPPHLSAPADRMERVLARAALARRRRRRAALAAGLAVGLTAAVLAAAPALAPGPTGTVLGPAASGPALGAIPPAGTPAGTPTDAPTASPEPSAGTSADAGGTDGGATGDQPGDGIAPPPRPTRFPALDGVIIDVPDSWSDLTVPATAGRPDSVGYISSQPLAREPGCQIRNGVQPQVCLAAGGLLDNAAIVSVRVIRDGRAATEAAKRTTLLLPVEPDKECLTEGGTQQFVAQQVVVPSGQAEVVELSACLRRPVQATLSTLYGLASSVRLFGTATNSPVISEG